MGNLLFSPRVFFVLIITIKIVVKTTAIAMSSTVIKKCNVIKVLTDKNQTL